MGAQLVVSVHCLIQRFKVMYHALYFGNNLVGNYFRRNCILKFTEDSPWRT